MTDQQDYITELENYTSDSIEIEINSSDSLENNIKIFVEKINSQEESKEIYGVQTIFLENKVVAKFNFYNQIKLSNSIFNLINIVFISILKEMKKSKTFSLSVGIFFLTLIKITLFIISN